MGIPAPEIGALGDILKFAEILSIIGTGMFVVFRVGRATERFELIGQLQAKEITELKDTVKEIAAAQIASISDRATIGSLVVQIGEVRQEIGLLRQGRGFIQREINGEWPK